MTNPNPDLDELAERLAELSEVDARTVIDKARSRDRATKQQQAAAAVKQFINPARSK
jgi:hypothetical protein